MSDLDSVTAVRPQCQRIFDRVQAGQSPYWSLDLSKLQAVAELVKSVSHERYPGGKVPYHSRLRHFPQDLLANIKQGTHAELGARYFDLVTVSVLLDAGAGAQWNYTIPSNTTSRTYSRSEGLGAASLVMFLHGFFSSLQTDKHMVDADRLCTIQLSELSDALQVSSNNPMTGLEGRWNLLKSLGNRLKELGLSRPSDLVNQLNPVGTSLNLEIVWKYLFHALSPLWPRKDIWNHPDLNISIPFHKLFQWLLYSYVEVLERIYGFTIVNKDIQTGLPEYRNGGLFVDCGVLVLKQPQSEPATVDSALIIEWRACTIVLLDLLHSEYFNHMPMCCMLEGGTWVAGRVAATRKRSDGSPPLQLILDGTVF